MPRFWGPFFANRKFVQILVNSFLIPLALFAAKTLTLVLAAVLFLTALARVLRFARGAEPEHLEITDINERLEILAQTMRLGMAPKAPSWRERRRLRRERQAARQKAAAEPRRRVFVLDFQGDIAASAVSALREEITAILQVGKAEDEVLLRLESAGGTVHGYGLAASQLHRLRDRQLQLTVCVDKVAASGGYMMACVADRIYSAPFAVIGSIGVVGQLPNFSRWLKKHDIDYELHTAGEFKRTLTVLGENSDTARSKFVAELQDTLELFKAFVHENRPQVAIDQVATGEHWFGRRALDLQLVDALRTSDDYLLECAGNRDVFELRYVPEDGWRGWIARHLTNLTRRAFG
jgi:serine protease SohB